MMVNICGICRDEFYVIGSEVQTKTADKNFSYTHLSITAPETYPD